MEADFIREYGIDLVAELEKMSWRKFMTLLRCLSPQSATITHVNQERTIGGKKGNVHTVVGTKATEQAFQSMFKDVGAKKRERVRPGPRVG